MVVAGGRRPEGDEVTVITPIDAILDPALWDQQQLTLLRAMPPGAEAPGGSAAGGWAALPRIAELPLQSHGGRAWKVTRDGIVLADGTAPLGSPGPTVTPARRSYSFSARRSSRPVVLTVSRPS